MKAMDHQAAVRSDAAIRYTLAEMTDQECEAFEEHFSSCSLCAEQVKRLSEFKEEIKDVLKNSSIFKRPRREK